MALFFSEVLCATGATRIPPVGDAPAPAMSWNRVAGNVPFEVFALATVSIEWESCEHCVDRVDHWMKVLEIPFLSLSLRPSTRWQRSKFCSAHVVELALNVVRSSEARKTQRDAIRALYHSLPFVRVCVHFGKLLGKIGDTAFQVLQRFVNVVFFV